MNVIRRGVAVALVATVLGSAALVAAAPAAANGYLYLNEKTWSRQDSAGNSYRLIARLAIETDDAGRGRFRFRLQCERIDAATGRTTPNSCDFHFASGSNAFWCNSQPPTQSGTPPVSCVGRHLDDQTGSDVLWVGTWHTMSHQVEFSHVNGFSATFNSGSGPVGVPHWIATAGAIVNLANQQANNDYPEWGSNCNYYSPGGPGAVCAEWCAMFATYVWDMVGVPEVTSEVRTTYVARMLGVWGQRWGNWHTTGPRPGDWVVWGPPANAIGGHNDIVVAVNSNGTLDVVGGNVNDKVHKRTVTPGVTESRGHTISGYVTPSY